MEKLIQDKAITPEDLAQRYGVSVRRLKTIIRQEFKDRFRHRREFLPGEVKEIADKIGPWTAEIMP